MIRHRNAASKRVVLIGAGHAHLHVAACAGRFVGREAELVLIDPGHFWYSGLATGVLGGQYDAELDRLDPAPLIEAGGGRFVSDRVTGVDPVAGRLRLASGESLGFDLVSLNLGSRVDTAGIEGADLATPVKPIPDLLARRATLLGSDPGSPAHRLVVVGGGATGCEIAANAAAWMRDRETPGGVTLVSASPRLLPGYTGLAARSVMRHLVRAGVEIVLGARIARIVRADTGLRLASSDDEWQADAVVLATGLIPPTDPGRWGLPTGPTGGLAVDAHLRTHEWPHVFGAGDCIDFGPRALPCLGVYAVRQAPVLLENLLAALDGGASRRYRPQRVALSILNLGGGDALAAWGPFHWMGRASLKLKEKLDLEFLERYRRTG